MTILQNSISRLATVAAFSLLLGVFSASSTHAATPPDSCFAFNAGTGTITDYYDHEANNSANPACTRDVDIPSTIGGTPVTVIGNSAFQSNQLTNVTIPSSVTSIGSSAFRSNQLTSVTIPSSVTSIGSSAFAYNQLTSVTIPSSVTSIGNSAFYDNQLTTVTIPSSVTSIGSYAFYDNQLTSVTIPNQSATMQHNSFEDNPITSMTIGATTYTEQSPTTEPACFAISGSNLTDYYQASPLVARDNGILCGRDVTIPSSVTSIGNSAFYDNQLTSVTIPSSVTSISNGAFSSNQLTTVTIPSSVTSIGNGAFSSNQLTNVTIPSSVTSIGNFAFQANSIREVTIPSSVTSLGEWAFGLQTPQGRAYDRLDLGDDPASVAMHNQTVSEFFYTRLYTEDPSNPNNLQSEVIFYATELDGLDEDWDEIAVVGGHIVNPASADLSYVNQSNAILSTTQTFTGQLPDNTYLANYNVSQGPTIPMPVDGWSPTPQEIADALAALDAYYRIGDTVTVDPPAIDGYITPEPQTFVLGAADNTFSYVYTQNTTSDGNPTTPVSSDGGELADTGLSTYAAYFVAISAMLVSTLFWKLNRRLGEYRR